jgi:hypothetical protein
MNYSEVEKGGNTEESQEYVEIKEVRVVILKVSNRQV